MVCSGGSNPPPLSNFLYIMNLNSKQTYTTTIFSVEHLENSYTITYNDESNLWEVVDDLNDDVENQTLREALIDHCESSNKTYVLFGSDIVRIAENTSLNAKEIASALDDICGGIYDIKVFNYDTPFTRVIDEAMGWGDYLPITKAKYDEIVSEYEKLQDKIPTPIEPESDSTPKPPKVWRDNDQFEGQYYARRCDITGEGMYKGWMVNGGDTYIKYESDAIEYCRKHWNQTLQEAYDESEENGGDQFYHTSWEEESDFEWRLVNGELVYGYEEPIDETTLKQEYFTSTEEMQHRMAMVLDDLAEIRKWAIKHEAPEEVLVMFSNIEIACDLDDNESLSWSKYSK